MSLDPAIAARLKRTADGLVPGDRAAARHRRGADARLDGRRGAGPHARRPAGRRTGAAPGRSTGSRARPPATGQWVREVRLDCDGDTLLVKVDQEGAGLPHRRPDLLRRRRAARRAASSRARWLTSATPDLRPGGRGRAGRRPALAAVAGHQPWAHGAAPADCGRAASATVGGRPGAGGQRAGAGRAGLLGRPAGDPGPGPPGRRGRSAVLAALGAGRRGRRSASAARRDEVRDAYRAARRRPTPTSSRTGWFWVAAVALRR